MVSCLSVCPSVSPSAVSCYKEAVQFGVSLLCHCLPIFDKICGMAMDFVFLSSEKH